MRRDESSGLRLLSLFPKACAFLVGISVFGSFAADAQTAAPGDQFLTLSYSSLDRSDAGTVRNASSVMLTYAVQKSTDLMLMGFLGNLRTDNVLPPDVQSSDARTIGFGAQYRLAPGLSVTGTVLYGDVSESFTSAGVTTSGSGDSLTGTLQFEQVIPLSSRTFLTGNASMSRSNAEFRSPTLGISNSPQVERYVAGVTLTHVASAKWILTAGYDHTNATNVITITGKKHLDRAKLGATYLINDDMGVTVGWTEGIDAEDTHRRIDLSFTRRF